MSAGAYDPTTLSERIQSQLTGIQQLSAYFAGLDIRERETAAILPLEATHRVAEMIRIHLGDEWWADLEQERAQAYLSRKQDALEQVDARSSLFARQLDNPVVPAQGLMPTLAPRQAIDSQPSLKQVEVSGPTIEDDEFLFQSDDLSITSASTAKAAVPVIPHVLAEIGQRLGTPLGLKDLVDDGGDTPEEGKVQMMDDGTVLNEEGLPFLDIREDLTTKSPAKMSLASSQDSAADLDDDSSDDEESDDYWSAKKVKGRQELKRRLFGVPPIKVEENHSIAASDTVNDENVVASEAVTSHSKAGVSAVLSKTPARGYMVKSTVINPSPPTPFVEELPSPTLPPAKPLSTPKRSTTSSNQIPSSSSEDDSRSARPGQPARRKSVTFAPEAHVRTFEKGEAMPMSAQGVDFPDPKDVAIREALLEAGVPETVLKPIATPAASGSNPKSASQEGGLFSGFKKGFLTAGPDGAKKAVSKPQPSAAYKAKLDASNSSMGVQPVPALVVSGPDADEESSDSRVPIAAPHDPTPPVPVKKSLFAQRKAEAAAKKAVADVDEEGQQDIPTPKPSAPMKQQVMERFSSSPKPTKKAPEPLPQPVKSRFGPPPKVPDLEEVLKQVQKTKGETSSSTPSTDGSIGGDADVSDETESLVDGEYSDDGEDYSPAGMEEKLLLRETVMAYHQQRASMGRQGLGGAVGQPEREPGLDDVDQPRSRAVGFGERVTPIGLEGGLPMPGARNGDPAFRRDHEHYDEDDEEGEEEDIDVPGGVLDLDNITLPTVIPGSTNLASGLRVGKLENGNLIVQAKDDSSDESEGEENEAEPLGPEELAHRKRRKVAKKAEEAMRRKLMDPDLAGLLRREAEKANAKRLAGDVANGDAGIDKGARMIGETPPVVRATPLANSGSMASVEKGEDAPSGTPLEEKPKKVSKFKAARLAAASQTESKPTPEPLRLRGGGFEDEEVADVTRSQPSQPSPPPGPFTIHHALMLRALDLTLNCEVAQTAFSVGSVVWLSSSSRFFPILLNHLGPAMRKAGEVGLILGESWSRAIPGNTHAEQNALTIFEERFGRIPDEVVRNIAGGDADAHPRGEVMKLVLADARIYATMEPCSIRTSGLPSCSAAILSSGLREVYIGVEEPADYVTCEGLRLLKEGGVVVYHVEGMAAECLRAARRGLVDGPIE